MKKGLKRALIAILITAIVVGAVIGGLLIYRNASKKPVNVFSVMNIGMTDYWGDTSQTEGIVETRNMQSIYVTATMSITEVFVKEGQSVKVGDPLMSVDTTLTEIELERQRITVEQTKLDLENAEKELKIVNSYVPYVPPAPEPEPEIVVLAPEQLPKFLGGQGTMERPYIYMWNDAQWYTAEFIDGILPKVVIETPEESVPAEGTPSEDSTAAPDNSTGTEESAGENPEESSAGETTPENSEMPEESAAAEESNTSDTTPKGPSVYVVFEKHDYDNSQGEMLENWMIRFVRNADNSVSFVMGDPTPNYDGKTPVISEEGVIDPGFYGPMFTWAEIQQMKAEAEKKIRDTELKLRVEEVKYEKLQIEMQTGIISATVDGVVKTLIDEDTARMQNVPMCVVSGGGGYYIQGTLSELELGTVEIGQYVTVLSWMSGYTSMEGQIIEIGEYPSSRGYNWGNGNTNVSYYPFTVYVTDDAALQQGEYVEIEYTPSVGAAGFYLENPFLREENGKCYVYVAGEDGLLEKREVTVGRSLWGSYTEILSGVSLDEYIAFPYGKDVVEGAPTEISSDLSVLYGGFY